MKTLAVLCLIAFASSALAVEWPHKHPPTNVENCAILKPHNHRGAVRMCVIFGKLQGVTVWVPVNNRRPARWQDAASKLAKLDKACARIERRLDRGKIEDNRRNRKREARLCS